MSNQISGKRIVFLVPPNGVEHAELTATWAAAQEAGGSPLLVSTAVVTAAGVQAGEPSKEAFAVAGLAREVPVPDYAALVLLRGREGSLKLRGKAEAVRLVMGFVAAGKPVAGISDGVGILVDAGVLAGKTMLVLPKFVQAMVTAFIQPPFFASTSQQHLIEKGAMPCHTNFPLGTTFGGILKPDTFKAR